MSSWHWKELLPVDRYIVRKKDSIHDFDLKVLSLLYQPLIGALAHSLYLTLWNEIDKDQYWSEETTHRSLMTMLDEPLDKIVEQRRKLEGIGLLKTYKRKKSDDVIFLYEIQPPMSPHDFFMNDVLSVYLFNRLGKKRYLHIRERFSSQKINKEEFEEVTYGFDQVFSSLHHSEIVANHHSEIGKSISFDDDKDVLHRTSDGLRIGTSSFDFDLLTADLPHFIDAEKVLTARVNEAIARLAFVYRIEPLEMSRILQQALVHHDEVNIEELRKKVQDWYRVEHGNEPPSLGLRTHPLEHRTMDNKDPITEEEKMIRIYETESPLSLLEQKASGSKVPLADAKVIESLLVDFHLLPGVANVLIDYVLMTNDMKLTKQLVEKIAGHWARKNFKTVKEAMEFAKQEHKKGKRWKQPKEANQQKKFDQMRYVRKDTLPKWYMEEKQEEKGKETQNKQLNYEEEKQRFEAMLMEFKKKKEEGDNNGVDK